MSRKVNRKGDDALVLALAAGATIKDAAKKAGVTERTAHRRLDEATFRKRVDDARNEMFARAIGALADATADAVGTLRKLLESKSESIRLGAGRAILEHAPKLRDAVDLDPRLRDVEARLEGLLK